MAKDRKTDMVILGLLFHEDLTGYDIKKRIDGAISFFWKGSFGSIYPSLNALAEAGLIVKTEKSDSSAGREKIYYAITDSGKTELLNWLKDSKAVNDLKYETLLKVFFGGAGGVQITLKTIENFERKIAEDLTVLKVYRDNLAGALSNPDHLYYYLTVSFGVETYEGYLRWCSEAKRLLADIK